MDALCRLATKWDLPGKSHTDLCERDGERAISHMDRYRRSGGRQAPKLCDSRDICVDVASEAWGGISCKFKSQKLEEPWVGAGEPEVMD